MIRPPLKRFEQIQGLRHPCMESIYRLSPNSETMRSLRSYQKTQSTTRGTTVNNHHPVEDLDRLWTLHEICSGPAPTTKEKSIEKSKENYMKNYWDLAQLLRRRVEANLNVERARKRDHNMMRRRQTQLVLHKHWRREPEVTAHTDNGWSRRYWRR